MEFASVKPASLKNQCDDVKQSTFQENQRKRSAPLGTIVMPACIYRSIAIGSAKFGGSARARAHSSLTPGGPFSQFAFRETSSAASSTFQPSPPAYIHPWRNANRSVSHMTTSACPCSHLVKKKKASYMNKDGSNIVSTEMPPKNKKPAEFFCGVP